MVIGIFVNLQKIILNRRGTTVFWVAGKSAQNAVFNAFSNIDAGASMLLKDEMAW